MIKCLKSKNSDAAEINSEVKRRRKLSRRRTTSFKRKIEIIFVIGIVLQLYLIFKSASFSKEEYGDEKSTKQNGSVDVHRGVERTQNVQDDKILSDDGSEHIPKPSEIVAKYEGKKMNTILEKNEGKKMNTILGVADRTKSIIAARLGLMKASNDIVDAVNKISISIVVSHCEENVKWIAKYLGDEYFIKDITIYSKCGKEVEGIQEIEGLSPTINIVRLPNVGRCDHTYANWIQEHYASIDKDREGNDLVMFLKDHARYRRKYIPIDLLFSQASKAGFACVTRPLCDCSKKCLNGFHVPTMQHKREYLLDFSLKEYTRVERDENSVFLSEEYTSLRKWKEEMGFVMPQSETVPVCYGGIFVAQKKQFFNQPEESWKKMEASLSRADNIIESHYAERLWASLLSDTDDESAKAVDEVLSPFVVKMVWRPKAGKVCGMAGMYYVHKNNPITAPAFEEKTS